MFGASKTSLADRLRRAAALVKAFAFLEDPPLAVARPCDELRFAAKHAEFQSATPGLRAEHQLPAHGHRIPLSRPARRRRPGTPSQRPTICLTPLTRRTTHTAAARRAPAAR